jgi:hypothetical protein
MSARLHGVIFHNKALLKVRKLGDEYNEYWLIAHVDSVTSSCYRPVARQRLLSSEILVTWFDNGWAI